MGAKQPLAVLHSKPALLLSDTAATLLPGSVTHSFAAPSQAGVPLAFWPHQKALMLTVQVEATHVILKFIITCSVWISGSPEPAILRPLQAEVMLNMMSLPLPLAAATCRRRTTAAECKLS